MVRDWSLPTENWGKGKDVSLPSPSEHPTQCNKKMTFTLFLSM